MNITRTPRRIIGRNTQIAVSDVGDVLTVDGVAYDFGALAEGDVYPESELSNFFASDATRIGGVIAVTVIENVTAEGVVL